MGMLKVTGRPVQTIRDPRDMTADPRIPSLHEHLALRDLRPLTVRRGLFRRPHVSMLSALIALAGAFEKGAVLGRARSERIEALSKLIYRGEFEKRDALSGRAGADLTRAAKADMEQYIESRSHEPVSFIDYLMTLMGHKLSQWQDHNVVQWLSRKKVRLRKVLEWANIWVLSGIGFGAAYPEP